jgi:hypothetical protein
MSACNRLFLLPVSTVAPSVIFLPRCRVAIEFHCPASKNTDMTLIPACRTVSCRIFRLNGVIPADRLCRNAIFRLRFFFPAKAGNQFSTIIMFVDAGFHQYDIIILALRHLLCAGTTA